VRLQLHLSFERLVITQSWANKASAGQAHHRHWHPNSFMSGVFYLTSGESGQTHFFQKDPWRNFFLVSGNSTADDRLTQTEMPIAGKLLLFPSSLVHSVAPFKSDDVRITISFNVFPEGRFDYQADNLRFLHLKVVPYTAYDEISP
jgi:uncharacterized protein (TIGR02466 family)